MADHESDRIDSTEAGYVSDAIVLALRELGYRYVPLVPGSSFRGLHDSLVNFAEGDPEMVLCLHEEIAVSLAHGYAKATGGACPAIVHDLVGLMHATMAVYNAFCDQIPVVLLGGGGPFDASLRRPKDWVHSAETQGELVREFVKSVGEPMTLDDTISAIYRSHQFAVSGPAGPTYVSIDMALQEDALPADHAPMTPRDFAPAPAIAADPEVVLAAITALRGARLPVVVGGQVARNPEAGPLLATLIESVGAAYHDDDNLVGLASDHQQNCTGDEGLLAEADVILLVDAADPSTIIPEERDDLVLIDLSLGDLRLKSWSHAFRRPLRRDLQLLADPMVGLRALSTAAASLPADAAVEERRHQVVKRASSLQERLVDRLKQHWDDQPISGPRLIAETWAAVKDLDWFLVLRNTRSWQEGIWKFTGSGQYLGHSGGGGVGYGPGAAVGGALAARDRGQFAVGIVGDGDLLMASGALWTAVHSKIPMLMVLNDNRSFYNDETHQVRVAKQRSRPVENAGVGIRVEDPPVDLAALARAYGCWAEGPITHPDELAAALQAAVVEVQAGRVAVVHAVTARGEG